MRILFIFKSENFVAPIGPAVISAVAKKEGHETFLCEINQQDPLECIPRLKPDVIAYSSSTGESKHYVKVNEKIKEKYPDMFTIMGGPHATFYPDQLKKTTLDALCVGEGEGATVDLLRALSVKRPISGIPNIYARDDTTFTVRGLIEDLDTVPFPDYDLLYSSTPMMGHSLLKSFMTSRGCPYPCTYCFNHAWRKLYQGKGTIIRRHSVDYVLEDIDRVRKKWPISTVKFYDDVFSYRADAWLEEFSRKYKERIGLPFFILTRCDLLTEDMVKLLKYAGCRTISMSIEAGNPEVRGNLLKRPMTNGQIIDSHRLCEKYGIYTFTNCIIGLPGTTFAHDLESLDLSLKCKVDWGEFLQFHPYPNTELGDWTIGLGLYSPVYTDMHTSYQYISPLNCFTTKEKNMQRNLAVLGPVVLVMPWTRALVVKVLLHFPMNFTFTLAYHLAKMYALRRKIYVTKTSFLESLRIFARSLRQDVFRHTREKEVGGKIGRSAKERRVNVASP